MKYDLERFVAAQDDHGVYEQALAELVRGRKTSHWMWFVFPQLAGLGRSAMARRYAIGGLDEAVAYLAHPVLGPRLRACVDALTATDGLDAISILGEVDAQKLQSCLTLFLRAAPGDPAFTGALQRFYAGHADPATDDLLRSPGPSAANR